MTADILNTESYIQTLQRFEKEFHGEVFEWIVEKMEHKDQIHILDFSIDHCVFSSIVGEKLKAVEITSVVRESSPIPASKCVQTTKLSGHFGPDCDFSSELRSKISGSFDVIILREILHEVEPNFDVFLRALRPFLKDNDSHMFIITRPKNPPVPLPDSGMEKWRKTSPSRELLISSVVKAGCYNQECYAISCPVRVPKSDWANFLRGRSLPALHNNAKCTDSDIEEFVSNKPSPNFEFEEKILIIVLSIKESAA